MENVVVAVIGAGQAGLAVGYHLKRLRQSFVIFDGGSAIGGPWRARWDSLKLFTPAQYDGLPGMPFPAARDTFPGKDEMADYLGAYAAHFQLPVELGRRVRRLRKEGDAYTLDFDGQNVRAKRVVIATGTNPTPKPPPFVLDAFQIHSVDYRNPKSVPAGDVLVVGGGTSGVEIALELANDRRVFLSGRLTFQIPRLLLRYAGRPYWWFVSNLLTVRTPMGRKARRAILGGHGAPLLRTGARELAAAKVERVPRLIGAESGRPKLEDGRVLDVRAVVWCNGFNAVGMPFQYALTSGLVGGVGRDAAYIAEHIAA
jgi:putative flavoprotein involved in K+ transport